MGRKIQSLLIVLFFGFMMVLLFRDHVIPGLSRPDGIDVDRAVLTDSWVNQDDYLVIQMGGMELGAMRQTAEHDAETDTYTSTMQVVANAGLLRGRILSVVK